MRRVKPSKRLVPRGAVWFLAGVSDEVIIRAAAREDVPGILLIYNAAVREPAAAYEDVPHTLAQREEWFDHFTGRNFPILVTETAGVIVGWGSLGPETSGDPSGRRDDTGGGPRPTHPSTWCRPW